MDLSHLREPKDQVYDFIFTWPEWPHHEEQGPDDMGDWAPNLFWGFYEFLLFFVHFV